MKDEMKPAELMFDRSGEGALTVSLAGDWRMENNLPSPEDVMKEVASGRLIKKIGYDSRELSSWDSGLLTFLLKLAEEAKGKGVQTMTDGLPAGVRQMLALAQAVPERAGARKESAHVPFLERLGGWATEYLASVKETVGFVGDVTLSVLRFFTGKADFRPSDVFLTIQECGAQALPIVTLISALVGMILAFVGAIQLKMFGAQIYVADVVGIGMVRVMGAIMTGIIMAGRTGAAFAAQLGTMQVNEEIDALRTLGVSPVDFLVLPRMLALSLMMPLLCIYADVMGILGGMVVGVMMLDLGVLEYYNETVAALNLTNVWIGLFHSAVFGVLIALAGCLRGIQCGRSASDVGKATTSAVVTSIVSIILATAIITFGCEVIGI